MKQFQSRVVGFFLVTFCLLVLLTVVSDALAKLIQRLFPERPDSANPVEPATPIA